MCDFLNQTEATRQEILANREAAMRVADRYRVDVEWRSDDGDWYTRVFSDEASARDFETKMKKQQVETRRVA